MHSLPCSPCSCVRSLFIHSFISSFIHSYINSLAITDLCLVPGLVPDSGCTEKEPRALPWAAGKDVYGTCLCLVAPARCFSSFLSLWSVFLKWLRKSTSRPLPTASQMFPLHQLHNNPRPVPWRLLTNRAGAGVWLGNGAHRYYSHIFQGELHPISRTSQGGFEDPVNRMHM